MIIEIWQRRTTKEKIGEYTRDRLLDLVGDVRSSQLRRVKGTPPELPLKSWAGPVTH